MTTTEQLEAAQALTKILARLAEIDSDLAKLHADWNELVTHRDELLNSLQNGTSPAKKPARGRKTTSRDETISEPESTTEPEATNPPETKTTEIEPETSVYQNDELDRMSLRELSDLSDDLHVPDSGRMNAQELRVAIREAQKQPPDTTDPLPGATAFDNVIKGRKPKKATAEPLPDITPDQQKDYESQDELYAAGVELATDGQKRMIFALLGTEHGVVSDVDKKAVIVGIIKEQHAGWVLVSTKELSKVWATGVIDYLKKAKSADLKKFYENEEPFE